MWYFDTPGLSSFVLLYISTNGWEVVPKGSFILVQTVSIDAEAPLDSGLKIAGMTNTPKGG